MRTIYLNGCYCMFHPATGDRGVVICGPLGDESLNAYRAQVFLGERLAEAGFPTLRVSYYGTGDSAGVDDEPDRFRAWIDSIITAARWLRSALGVSSITLCGLRIGAALATRAACELHDLEALVLVAPVASGRRFLRGQILTAATIADIWKSSSNTNDGNWFEAYGLRLDLATRDALDALDISRIDGLPVCRVLLLDQPGTPPNDRLTAGLRRKGIDVTHEIAPHYDRLLRDSHEAEVPHQTFDRIITWLGVAACSNPPIVDAASAHLELSGLREHPVRIGTDGSLFGVLALPMQHASTDPVVLMPSTGANPRFGASRATVTLARWLAEQGIPSLRMDGHGIGDSTPATGERGIPYGKQGDRDVSSCIDFLATRYGSPIIVLGMCSGAYHAFQAALVDHRIRGLILVNLQKFVWRDGESLSVVQRTTFRTTGFYLRNLANPAMLRRLLSGQINVSGITRALASRAARQLVAAADPAVTAVMGETQTGMVRRQLAELSARSVRILYVLSGNDPGLDEIAEYFGIRGWRLRRTAGVMFDTIDGADHTLSANWARQRLMQGIAAFLNQRFGVRIAAGAAEPGNLAQPPPHRSVVYAAIRRKRRIAIDSAPTTA